MTIDVLMFGPARDLAGLETCSVQLESGAELGALIEALGRRFPKLAPGFEPRGEAGRPAYRCAVNEAFCGLDRALVEGDRVAVIPPVSGGADGDDDTDHVELVRNPIDAGWVRERVGGCREVGGIAMFEGTTRADRHPQHRGLVRLFYEAYAEMALVQMRSLLAQARGRWAIERMVMIHRLGEVPIGETSISIAVACPHRGDAFEACRFLIDQLKKEVPIWKKEVWADGEQSWVNPTAGGGEPPRADRDVSPG